MQNFKNILTILDLVFMSSANPLDSEMISYIEYPNEERYLEFKGSIKWSGDVRAKITKSIMAFSNLKDGGWIVIGKEEEPDRSFAITGMTQEDYDSFDSDEIKAYVYSRTDPPVAFNVYKKEYKKMKFVLIQIKEFETLPTICKRSYNDILHAGRLYVRSKGKPESIAVPSSAEMREVVDIAIDKRVEQYIQRAKRVGLISFITQPEKEDEEETFAKEIQDSLKE